MKPPVASKGLGGVQLLARAPSWVRHLSLATPVALDDSRDDVSRIFFFSFSVCRCAERGQPQGLRNDVVRFFEERGCVTQAVIRFVIFASLSQSSLCVIDRVLEGFAGKMLIKLAAFTFCKAVVDFALTRELLTCYSIGILDIRSSIFARPCKSPPFVPAFSLSTQPSV